MILKMNFIFIFNIRAKAGCLRDSRQDAGATCEGQDAFATAGKMPALRENLS